MRTTALLALLASGALLATACGGPTTSGKAKVRKAVKVTPPKTVNHMEAVFQVVESPPSDVESAWGQLATAQGALVGKVFHPGWTAERQTAAMQVAWQAWSRRWPDVRTGLYRLENRLVGAVANAARAYTRTAGSLPEATVHLFFVPDRRLGTAAWVDGKGIVGLNAGPLALLTEEALEREIVRQIAVLAVLAHDQRQPTLGFGLYLEGLGAWAVRAVRPRTLEAEVMGCTPEQLTAAQARLRDVGTELAGALDATDAPTLDRWLVHGDADPSRPLAARLAAYSVVREIARDGLPAEVIALGFEPFHARAISFWTPAGAVATSGTLVESRSAAEEARIARGGKTAGCVGAYSEEGQPVALDLPGGRWVLKGARLEAELGSGSVTLGLIGDIKRADDDTLANIRHFVEEFRKAGVQAILVPGDVAETTAGIRDAVDVLTSLGVPVYVIPGNRESQARYRQAMDPALKKYPHLIDMTRVRLVDTDRYAVVSLPGYYDARYTYAKDGCLYDAKDVAALAPISAKATGRPRILMAHSPPKAKGKDAIDWADANANVGDPEMTKLLRMGGFEAGVYANLHETGGRAARGDLKTRVRPGKWVPDIHLVTGSANAMEWPMLDGRVSSGMAGLLDIKGGKLRYRVLRK